MAITSFTGRYIFLSNFYRIDVPYEDLIYPSVEHAYQAAKTLDDRDRRKIRQAATPGLAKKYGYRVDLRDGWDKLRLKIMYDLLQIKFSNSQLLAQLYKTAPEALVEGNTWGDRFWGQDPVGKGENWLGRLLMELRDGPSNRCPISPFTSPWSSSR